MSQNMRTTNCSQLGFKLGFLGGSEAKDHLPMQEMCIWSLGQEDALEKEMTTQFNNLDREIPCREESGMLQPMGSQKSQRCLSS